MKNVKKHKYADMDPIEEIRAIRAEIGRRFKTAREYVEYLWKNYPSSRPADWSPEWMTSEPKVTKSQAWSRRTAVKTVKRSVARRRKTAA